MNNTQRHLAAILFTDIVGYTAMMQENEAKAVSAIKRHNQVLEKLAKNYHGRVANYFGDGSLCIFQSSTEALQCALEIQQELNKEPAVPLRIGLHIGEVFFEDDKAIGDGVNIASRIQSLGQANTILLSREIVDKIRNHPEFKPVSLGSFEFKNVNEPLEVFALANEGLAVPKKNSIEGKLKAPTAKILSRKTAVFVTSLLLLSLAVFFLVRKFTSAAHGRAIEKSIAVLPFANMSNDKEQEYFSEGITDDILDHLAKISDLKVKSRTSTLRYRGSIKTMTEIGDELGVGSILEGSVRKSGNTVRIVVQLIDTKTDEHLFSQTYDREIKDVLTTQSEIAMEIANALQAKLSPIEKENISKKASVDISAYDYYLKARDILFRAGDDQKGNEKAVQFLRSAIALDSNYAGAYALMSIFYNNKKWFGVPSSIWTDSALLLAQMAIRLDPQLPDGYISRVNILIQEGHFQDAEADLNKANILAPNNGLVLELMAQSLEAKGEFKRAATSEIKAIDILFSKKDPEYSDFWGYLYFVSKDYYRAEKMYSLAFSLDPGNYQSMLSLGRLYFDQKKYKEAAISYEKVLVIDPKVTLAIDGLSWCYYLMGNTDKAAEGWAK
ncbi:MAG: adenylate/guanylate cyclase domain-containing protein, partial [Chitinophagales bacterium]